VTPWAYLRLVLLGALIGIPAALVAFAFLAIVHELEHSLWHDLPTALGESSPQWYLVIGLPVVGACVVVIARRFLPGDGGIEPLRGFAGEAPLLSYAPGVALAALGTLAFGAVLGPEAPLIALGSMVGITVTGLARLGPQESAVLGTAGVFCRHNIVHSRRRCASVWAIVIRGREVSPMNAASIAGLPSQPTIARLS
jgi:H+/Cl- antiporter ClcA